MVSRMDGHVGQIMTLLKKLSINDNTVMFFSSDNGPQGDAWKRLSDFFDGNGPLRGYKGEFYEGGIRVPMIVRWPGKIQPRFVTDHVCAFWDFLPTAAQIAGVQPPQGIDGLSFLSTLVGKKGEQKKHRFLYWEYPSGNRIVQAVRMGDWKAVQLKPGTPLELYNLQQDPAETTNIADKHPEIMKQITDYLATARTQERNYPEENSRPNVKDYVR